MIDFRRSYNKIELENDEGKKLQLYVTGWDSLIWKKGFGLLNRNIKIKCSCYPEENHAFIISFFSSKVSKASFVRFSFDTNTNIIKGDVGELIEIPSFKVKHEYAENVKLWIKLDVFEKIEKQFIRKAKLKLVKKLISELEEELENE